MNIQACLTFDVDAETAILCESGLYARNAGVMSHQAYGPLVGMPRILGLLREYSLPATFFVPGFTADRYPRTVEAILEEGHEIAHHSYAHFSPFAQTEEEERADFERALQTLRRAGGKSRNDVRVRQNLALVVGLQGRFAEAETIARADLPPDEAAANVAYLKDMLNRKDSPRAGRGTIPVAALKHD